MDPINNGASVIAFLGLTLQCTKTLIDFIGSIKDGPEHVKRAVDMVLSLQEILNQLSSRRVILEARDRQAIETRLKNCRDDLRVFVVKLDKLRCLETEDESRGHRVWKRIRTAFSDKDLEAVMNVVGIHSSSLGLWLHSNQSELIYSINDAVTSHEQHLPTMKAQLETVHSSIVDARTEMAEIDHRRREEASHTKTRLDAIEDKIREAVAGRFAFETLHGQGLATIHTKVDEASTMRHEMESQEYSKTKGERRAYTESLQCAVRGALTSFGPALIMQLQEQLETIQHGNNDQGQNAASCMGQAECGRVEHRLLRGLERLCQLVDAEGQVLAAEAVDTILEDLQAVLQAALEQSQIASDEHEIKRLIKAISSIPRLPLNQISIRHQPPQSFYQTTRSQAYAEFPFPDGILSIVTRKARFIPLPGTDEDSHRTRNGRKHDDQNRDHSDALDVLKTQLRYIHKTSPQQAIILMKLTQHIHETGTSTSIPQLCVNRVLPASSPVFYAVSSGNLEELQCLLLTGQASLRDHDEHGKSLLVYAAESHQPDICRFLLEKGADVDICFEIPDFPTSPVTVISAILIRGGFQENLKLARKSTLRCLRYLLDSGADPTHVDGLSLSVAQFIFIMGVVPYARCLLDHGATFVSATSTEIGETHLDPFLQACCRPLTPLSASLFDFLLNRGASLFGRDDCGRTCLHLCFLSVQVRHNTEDPNPVQDRDAILYLIKRGADIRAKDASGKTISHFARRASRRHGWVGTYGNDLWDAVLAICGLDTIDFGGDSSMLGHHTEWYPRVDFQRLWTGYEDLCPYPERLSTPYNAGDNWDTASSEGCDSDIECNDLNCDYCHRCSDGPQMVIPENKDIPGLLGHRGNRPSTDLEGTDDWLRDGDSQNADKGLALDLIGEGADGPSLRVDYESTGLDLVGVTSVQVQEPGQRPVSRSLPNWAEFELENPWLEE